MNEAKFQEVFGDEVFVKNMLTLETAEEVQAALQKKGLDLTVEDINKLKGMIAQKQNAGEELSDEALENVAGGTVTGGIGGIIGALAGGPGLNMNPDVLKNSKW